MMRKIFFFTFILIVNNSFAQVQIPVGGIVPYSGDLSLLDKSQWVVCDGSALKISEYLELFKVIRWNYGYGNDTVGRSYFSLPDYRGVFLRGVDQGKGIDIDAKTRSLPGNMSVILGDKVGSFQSDAIQKHNHTDSGHIHKTNATAAIGQVDSDNSDEKAAPPNSPTASIDLGYARLGDPSDSKTGAGKPRLSLETRPINISVYWIVKVK